MQDVGGAGGRKTFLCCSTFECFSGHPFPEPRLKLQGLTRPAEEECVKAERGTRAKGIPALATSYSPVLSDVVRRDYPWSNDATETRLV